MPEKITVSIELTSYNIIFITLLITSKQNLQKNIYLWTSSTKLYFPRNFWLQVYHNRLHWSTRVNRKNHSIKSPKLISLNKQTPKMKYKMADVFLHKMEVKSIKKIDAAFHLSDLESESWGKHNKKPSVLLFIYCIY